MADTTDDATVHVHRFEYSNTPGVDICECGAMQDWPKGSD